MSEARVHIHPELLAHAERIGDLPLSLVTAPGGSGKTTLLEAWRETLDARGDRTAWLAVSRDLHADAVVLVEDLVDSMRAALPESLEGADSFGTHTLLALPRSGDVHAASLARTLLRELRDLAAPVVLFLDGFERIPRDSESFALFDSLLRAEPEALRWVIATRGTRPTAATRLLAYERAHELDAADLSLQADQLRGVLADRGVEHDDSLVGGLLARTEGWAIAVRLAVRALAERSVEDRADFVENLGKQRDLFAFIAEELIESASPGVVPVLETAALLGRCDVETLRDASGIADAAQRIEEAIDEGLLIAREGRVWVHDLWRDLLRDRLRERLDTAEWNALHERIGESLEARGDPRAALALYVAGDAHARTAELLERSGDVWLAAGHRDAVRSALASLPDDVRSKRPAIEALEGVLLGGADPARAIEHLRRAAALQRKAGNRRAEFTTLHELGIIAMNENRMGDVRSVMAEAMSLRRLATDPQVRGLVLMGLAGGAFLSGRARLALRLFSAASREDHLPRERGGIALMRNTIRMQMGRWDEALDELDEILSDPEGRQHGPSFFALQTIRAVIQGSRGIEIERAISRLEESRDVFIDIHQTLNAARAEEALGRLAAKSGADVRAVEHLGNAADLCQRIRLDLGRVNALALRAQAQLRLGAEAEAVADARDVLSTLSRPASATTRRMREAPSSPPLPRSPATYSPRPDFSPKRSTLSDSMRSAWSFPSSHSASTPSR